MLRRTPLDRLEHDVLRALPQNLRAQCSQFFLTFNDGQKVVAGKLPHLAGEAAGAVGQDDFCLAVAARVEQDVADRGVTGVVFEICAQLEVAQRYPAAFAAPAHVNDLLTVGQKLHERRHGDRRVGMGLGDEGAASGGNFDVGHGRQGD